MTNVKLVIESPSRFDVLKTWFLRAVVALFFVWVGTSKFAAHSQWVRIFQLIGFGQWFRYLTGTLQVAGGLLVLIPRTFVFGILILACTMAGAMAAWMFFLGSPFTAVIPGVLLVGLVLVGGEDFMNLIFRRE
jgi:putative oxidoreductase